MDSAFVAASNGDSETLKSVLESENKDQLFFYVDEDENNVLHKAVIVNNAQCVRLIVDAFPSLTEEINSNGITPLHLACYIKADLNIIKILCEFKNTLNMRNEQTNTPLFAALIKNGENNKIDDGYISEIIKILIENGADVHVIGRFGFTILHEAVFSNKFEEFKLLLNYGVKIDKQDNANRTVLHIATSMSKRCEFVKFILEKEPKLVLILDEELNCPLLRASENACENCIELLIKNNADVLHTNCEGESCIELAVRSGKVKNVEKLLQYGADPMIYGGVWRNVPPLLYACGENHVEIVELLLNHESINRYVVDKNIHPLRYVLQYNTNPKMLKLIINHPPFLDKTLTVDINITNFFSCGLVGFFLFTNFLNPKFSSDGMLPCLEILLQENFPLNHTNGALSALSSLLLTFSKPSKHYNLLEIVKILIQYKCDVNDMSMSDEFCEKYAINVELRNELQIPDALVFAFLSEKLTVAMHLLRYWPQPPVLLLLMQPRRIVKKLVKWFEILIEFGWPTGNKFVKQIEELIDREDEEKKDVCLIKNPNSSPNYFEKLVVPLNQNPSSLKCLAKFATRSYLFEKKSEFGMTLPTLIESLDIPSTLTDELLFVSHKKVVEIEESDDEFSEFDESYEEGSDDTDNELMEMG